MIHLDNGVTEILHADGGKLSLLQPILGDVGKYGCSRKYWPHLEIGTFWAVTARPLLQVHPRRSGLQDSRRGTARTGPEGDRHLRGKSGENMRTFKGRKILSFVRHVDVALSKMETESCHDVLSQL